MDGDGLNIQAKSISMLNLGILAYIIQIYM